MNTRRLVLVLDRVGMPDAGRLPSLQAGEVSVAELIGNLKSADESARLQAIDQLGLAARRPPRPSPR